MGQYDAFFKKEKKKVKKNLMEKKTEKLLRKENYILPTVEIIKKGKNSK